MAAATDKALAAVVLRHYGTTFAKQSGSRVEQNTPSALFQLLNIALLLSARIRTANAMAAATALRKAGLTTPRRMVEASWQDRVDVITWHGYKRYDERTATMLGDTARLVLERYRGDLRRLRVAAQYEAAKEKPLLKEFKGIGDTGADIFLREAQLVWDEVYPYADKKVLSIAGKLGLPSDPQRLSQLVAHEDFARLVAGLIRVSLEGAHEKIRAEARG